MNMIGLDCKVSLLVSRDSRKGRQDNKPSKYWAMPGLFFCEAGFDANSLEESRCGPVSAVLFEEPSRMGLPARSRVATIEPGV